MKEELEINQKTNKEDNDTNILELLKLIASNIGKYLVHDEDKKDTINTNPLLKVIEGMSERGKDFEDMFEREKGYKFSAGEIKPSLLLNTTEEDYSNRYYEEIINELREIKINTNSISELETLFRVNNEQQKEILQEIFSLSTEKDKTIAETKYRKIMNKITQGTSDIETMQKLQGILNAVFLFIYK